MDSKESRFVDVLREKIVSLPFDLKVCFAVVADEDQPEEVRLLAAGTVLYVLGPNDIIPDHLMPVGFADDAIIFWAMLDHFRRKYPDTAQKFSERFDGIFDSAEQTAEVFRDYLGELYDWLAGKLPTLPQQVYKGTRAAEYIEDPEAGDFLYEEGQAFVTDFDVDEDYLANRLRGQKVREALAKRVSEEQLRNR
jgi:uncharacterized membrane protein YkvA (DUF1232 family)